jgi:hypothetical protein
VVTTGVASSGNASVLLVLDYPGYRPEARVDELGLPRNTGLRVAELLRAPLPTAVTAAGYAAELLARRPEGEIGAVLAYCAAAPLATELVAQTGTDDRRPPLVLFDAEPTTVSSLLDAYRDTLTQLGVAATPQEAATLAALAHRPEEFIAIARRNLIAHVSRTLLADGCDPGEVDLAAQLTTDSCTDWLTHLLAALHAPPPKRSGPVLRITSADVPGGDLRIPCERTSLLRDPRTREAVLSFLASHGVPLAK